MSRALDWHLPQKRSPISLKNLKRVRFSDFLVSCCGFRFSHLSISQLVEQSTVDEVLAILRSLVQFRLREEIGFNFGIHVSISSDFVSPEKKSLYIKIQIYPVTKKGRFFILYISCQ